MQNKINDDQSLSDEEEEIFRRLSTRLNFDKASKELSWSEIKRLVMEDHRRQIENLLKGIEMEGE